MATSASLVKWRRLAGSTPARCTPRQSHDTSALLLLACLLLSPTVAATAAGSAAVQTRGASTLQLGARSTCSACPRRTSTQRPAMPGHGNRWRVRRWASSPTVPGCACPAQRRDGCAALVPVAEVAGTRPGRGAPALPGQRSLGAPMLAGDALALSARPLADHHFVYPLELPPGERAVVYLQVQARETGVAAGADRREAVRRGPPAGRHPGQPVLRRHPR